MQPDNANHPHPAQEPTHALLPKSAAEWSLFTANTALGILLLLGPWSLGLAVSYLIASFTDDQATVDGGRWAVYLAWAVLVWRLNLLGRIAKAIRSAGYMRAHLAVLFTVVIATFVTTTHPAVMMLIERQYVTHYTRVPDERALTLRHCERYVDDLQMAETMQLLCRAARRAQQPTRTTGFI